MKKLIFLLLTAAFLAGFALAQDVAHPPGALALEAALYGGSADGRAVIPDMVPVLAWPVTAELSGFQAVMAIYGNDETAIQPQGYHLIKPIDMRQAAARQEPDYWLRL